MTYKITENDKAQWEALHGEKANCGMSDVSNLLAKELEKNVDGCQKSIDQVRIDIIKFEDWCASEKYPQSIVEELKKSIEQAKIYIRFTEMLGSFYLIQMDVNTYTNHILIADDEWEWRTYARHFYTILYEHQNSVNRVLNVILNQSLEAFGKDSVQYKNLKLEKKEFVKIINENSEYAKNIRITTDAHYDGGFIERKEMIESMSYSTIVALINNYLVRSGLLVKSIQPLIEEKGKALNDTLESVIKAMESYISSLKGSKKNSVVN